MRLPNGLNPRQQAFVLAYLVCFNATQAAIEAGYSPKTAAICGFQLLRNPKIAPALAEAQAKRNEKHEGLADRAIAEVKKLAFLDETENGEWSFARCVTKQKALDWLAKHLGLWKQPDAPPSSSTTVNVLVSNEDAARIIGSLVGRAQLSNGNGGGGNGNADH